MAGPGHERTAGGALRGPELSSLPGTSGQSDEEPRGTAKALWVSCDEWQFEPDNGAGGTAGSLSADVSPADPPCRSHVDECVVGHDCDGQGHDHENGERLGRLALHRIYRSAATETA